MRDQQFEDVPNEELTEEPTVEPPQLQIDDAGFPETPESPEPQFDMVGDLREQIGEPEEDLDYRERPQIVQLLMEQEFVRFLVRLQPWQRFVLAFALFMDIALCGCMALLITQKIWLPF
jgi:hypothetical protein